eukprot:Awhi_evm1s13694
MSSSVLVRVINGVATVTLNRPKARNALNRELIANFKKTMTELDQDDHVRVIVLTGADPAFCGGVDLKEMGTMNHEEVK